MKRLQAQLAELRTRRQALEDELRQVLQHMNEPGILIGGLELSLETRPQRERVGRKRRETEIAQILAAHSVRDVDGILQELRGLGTVGERSVLKVKRKK